jgi:hypothetical protein
MRTLIFVGLCCGLASLIVIAESRTSHLPSRPTQVEVSYRPRESTMTLHEPVVVLFSVHNGLSRSITLTLGAQGRQFFQSSLTTPDGQVIESSFLLPGQVANVATFGSGKVEVAPGADYQQMLSMNQLFGFNTPGTYLLTSQLTTSIEVAGYASLSPQSQTIRLVIKPRDTARLEKVCADLARQVATAKGVEEEREPALELSYVDDPIAVPYLAQVLSRHMFNYHLAIPGLERIGNEAAVEVLLSTLGDDYGDMADLARQALTRMQDRISNPNLKETVKRALAPKTGD